ncbi:family 16 glycoside hydrolase [Polaribacter porphyrae]|uniref:3-keto-alpha-glucoside-1,2-lyase/3-keto-2-hydroxy-glucal hydratase domain-containing protein n=1 Tax=Polaribacter porphyrae TaxID=1137780 RepID=A0A2S7WRY6_9FLAO|nr:family 16 glycoside hydrolase [Polaribacter porphyrae]PQJ80358.1 hypothetical protein BTO18_14765 [Polaribacter porphyrae]
MKKRNQIILMLLFSISTASFCQKKVEKINAQELNKWQTFDKGKKTIKGNEIIIEETEGSNGYFLISPKIYDKDFTLNYKVKAMSESTVLITLFSVLQNTASTIFTLPKENATPRQVWDWRSSMKHYNLTINNKSHRNKPFFFKNNSKLSKGFNERLANNIMEVGKWYTVEIGKKNNRIWFKLNDKLYYDIQDCNPLKKGRIIFRISGTNGDKVIFAKASFKDVVISY